MMRQAVLAEFSPELVIVEHAGDRAGELFGMLWFDKQTLLAVQHGHRSRRGRAWRRRARGGEGFEYDHWHPFGQDARKDKQVELVELGLNRRAKAAPFEYVGDVQLRGQRVDLLFVLRCFKAANDAELEAFALVA